MYGVCLYFFVSTQLISMCSIIFILQHCQKALELIYWQSYQHFYDLSDLYAFDLFFILCWRMPSLCKTSIRSSDNLSNTSSVIVMSLNSTA